MKKKLISIWMALLLLMISVFVYSENMVHASDLEEPHVVLRVEAPNEAFIGGKFKATVRLEVPETIQIHVLETNLFYDPKVFTCVETDIVVCAPFDNSDVGLRGDTIAFGHDTTKSVIKAGSYTLFTVEFSIAEDAREDNYLFYFKTKEMAESLFDKDGKFDDFSDIKYTEENAVVSVETEKAEPKPDPEPDPEPKPEQKPNPDPEPEPQPQRKKGDVNGDGKITASDYVNVKFHVLGKQTLTGTARLAADVNGDGKITASDYVNIKFKVLGKI